MEEWEINKMALTMPSAVLRMIDEERDLHNTLFDGVSLRIYEYLESSRGTPRTPNEIHNEIKYTRHTLNKNSVTKRLHYMKFLGIIEETQRRVKTRTGKTTLMKAFISVPLPQYKERVASELDSIINK